MPARPIYMYEVVNASFPCRKARLITNRLQVLLVMISAGCP